MTDDKPIFSAAQMRRATIKRAKAPPKAEFNQYIIEGKTYTAGQAVAEALRRCKNAVKADTIRKRVVAGKKTWEELIAPPHGDRAARRRQHERLFKVSEAKRKAKKGKA